MGVALLTGLFGVVVVIAVVVLRPVPTASSAPITGTSNVDDTVKICREVELIVCLTVGAGCLSLVCELGLVAAVSAVLTAELDSTTGGGKYKRSVVATALVVCVEDGSIAVGWKLVVVADDGVVLW